MRLRFQPSFASVSPRRLVFASASEINDYKKMYLLAFLIFIAFASPTNQEFVQCKSHIWRWKLEFAVNSSTRVETVAGTNLTIACGAVCQLSKRQECGGATVQWFRVPKWNLSKAEALPYAFWSSGAITYEPYMGAGVPSLYGLRHRCRKER